MKPTSDDVVALALWLGRLSTRRAIEADARHHGVAIPARVVDVLDWCEVVRRSAVAAADAREPQPSAVAVSTPLVQSLQVEECAEGAPPTTSTPVEPERVLVTVTEYARLKGCSTQNVRKRLSRGTLPGHKQGGRWAVDATSLNPQELHP